MLYPAETNYITTLNILIPICEIALKPLSGVPFIPQNSSLYNRNWRLIVSKTLLDKQMSPFINIINNINAVYGNRVNALRFHSTQTTQSSCTNEVNALC